MSPEPFPHIKNHPAQDFVCVSATHFIRFSDQQCPFFPVTLCPLAEVVHESQIVNDLGIILIGFKSKGECLVKLSFVEKFLGKEFFAFHFMFFEDLCTVPELKALSQRIVVAKMLSDGRVYSDIVKATGASTATISRVNRSLEYGCDSYALIFDRMDEESKKI